MIRRIALLLAVCATGWAQSLPLPGPGMPESNAAAFDAGFDFRATSGFVSDPGYATRQLVDGSGIPVETYPTTRTVNGSTVRFGWETGGTNLGPGRDRNSGIDARLAGLNQVGNGKPGNAVWRLDLPAPGTYEIDLALGDASFSQVQNVEIQDGTTTVISFTNVVTASGAFLDATGVIRSSAANWVAGHATRNVTFSSSVLHLVLKPPTGSSSTIAHLRITRVP